MALKPNGAVIDFTKKPIGTVTRIWSGRKVGWVTRCAKCDRRGERSVFIPESTARRGGGKPYVSWAHSGHVVDFGIRFFSVDDHCMVVITAENADDLLNVEERRDFDALPVAATA